MRPPDWLRAAETLAASARGQHAEVFLRRATSSAYYAVFHTLARTCADQLTGRHRGELSRRAWQLTYRAVDHGAARTACRNIDRSLFSSGILEFANIFVLLQARRQAADYDPDLAFDRSSVEADITFGRVALTELISAPLTERRAFAAHVLFRKRTG